MVETKHMPTEREIEAAAEALRANREKCKLNGVVYADEGCTDYCSCVKDAQIAVAAIAALPVQVAGKPVAWLRDAQPDAEDEALVVCNRIDPGAFPVFASPPAPASQVLLNMPSQLQLNEAAYAMVLEHSAQQKEGGVTNWTKIAEVGIAAIIDHITNKDAGGGL